MTSLRPDERNAGAIAGTKPFATKIVRQNEKSY
jgi:hypothetical protein